MAIYLDVKNNLNSSIWSSFSLINDQIFWPRKYKIGHVRAQDDSYLTRLNAKALSLEHSNYDQVFVSSIKNVFVNNIGNLVSLDLSPLDELILFDSDQQSENYLSMAHHPAKRDYLKTIELDLAMPILRPGDHIYGHWLIDILPRLYLLRKIVDIRGIKIVVRHDIPKFALSMLELMGVRDKDIVFFNPNTQNLKCKVAYYVTNLRKDQKIHPLIEDFSNWFKDIILDVPGRSYTINKDAKKIFISRSNWEKPSPRRVCVNALSIEALLSSKGWKILHPQELRLVEQVMYFANAEIIFGEEGSGLHNSIFMEGDTNIVSMRNSKNLGMIQSGLCRSRNQTENFIFGQGLPGEKLGREENFMVDINDTCDIVESLA